MAWEDAYRMTIKSLVPGVAIQTVSYGRNGTGGKAALACGDLRDQRQMLELLEGVAHRGESAPRQPRSGGRLNCWMKAGRVLGGGGDGVYAMGMRRGRQGGAVFDLCGPSFRSSCWSRRDPRLSHHGRPALLADCCSPALHGAAASGSPPRCAHDKSTTGTIHGYYQPAQARAMIAVSFSPAISISVLGTGCN